MVRFLPLIFLFSIFSFFGIILIFWYVNPDNAPWYIFALFIVMVFVFVWGILGTFLYFLRTRFYRRYSAKWYFTTSFKMAFFVSFFTTIVTTLAVLQLVTTMNIFLTIISVSFLAAWSYLGKKVTEKE